MDIRTATLEDLEAVTEVERRCFPEAEAATKEEFAGWKKRSNPYMQRRTGALLHKIWIQK